MADIILDTFLGIGLVFFLVKFFFFRSKSIEEGGEIKSADIAVAIRRVQRGK